MEAVLAGEVRREGELAPHETLGDRMKAVEQAETGRRASPRLPIYARVDGRSFSRFTRDLKKPFDERFNSCMVDTARSIMASLHAPLAYVQSDEISFVWPPFQEHQTPPFDAKVHKLTSVLAASATAAFLAAVVRHMPDRIDLLDRQPHFDCRVLNLRDSHECADMILWRELDARRNAVSRAAASVFSPRVLMGVSMGGMLRMLREAGQPFEHHPDSFARGTYLRRQALARPPADGSEKVIVQPRTQIVELALPPLRDVANPAEVLLAGEAPVIVPRPSPDPNR